MTMFTLHLPLAVFSFSKYRCVRTKGDNYFALFSFMYSFFQENKLLESHVCSLKTASEHIAVKYGMKKTNESVRQNATEA